MHICECWLRGWCVFGADRVPDGISFWRFFFFVASFWPFFVAVLFVIRVVYHNINLLSFVLRFWCVRNASVNNVVALELLFKWLIYAVESRVSTETDKRSAAPQHLELFFIHQNTSRRLRIRVHVQTDGEGHRNCLTYLCRMASSDTLYPLENRVKNRQNENSTRNDECLLINI